MDELNLHLWVMNDQIAFFLFLTHSYHLDVDMTIHSSVLHYIGYFITSISCVVLWLVMAWQIEADIIWNNEGRVGQGESLGRMKAQARRVHQGNTCGCMKRRRDNNHATLEFYFETPFPFMNESQVCIYFPPSHNTILSSVSFPFSGQFTEFESILWIRSWWRRLHKSYGDWRKTSIITNQDF